MVEVAKAKRRETETRNIVNDEESPFVDIQKRREPWDDEDKTHHVRAGPESEAPCSQRENERGPDTIVGDGRGRQNERASWLPGAPGFLIF